MGVPYTSAPPNPHGSDLIVYQDYVGHFHSYAIADFQESLKYRYTAPVIFFYRVFLPLPHDVLAIQAVILAVFALLAFLLGRRMIADDLPARTTTWFLLACLAMSYPLYLEWRQGNVEIFLFGLLVAAVFGFCRGHLTLAALCIGIATAMKIYPFVFLGLFLARRQYRPIVIAAITIAITTLISLAYLTPSIALSWQVVASGLEYYRVKVFLPFVHDGIGWDHSLFVPVKMIAHRVIPSVDMALVLRAYLLLGAVIGAVAYFARIRFLPVLNQVLCLTAASVFLTPSSFDYTLISLYLPWGMLVLYSLRHEPRSERIPGLSAVFAVLAFLTASETELIYNGYGRGGAVKALLFPVLFYLGLKYPFAEQSDSAFTEDATHLNARTA